MKKILTIISLILITTSCSFGKKTEEKTTANTGETIELNAPIIEEEEIEITEEKISEMINSKEDSEVLLEGVEKKEESNEGEQIENQNKKEDKEEETDLNGEEDEMIEDAINELNNIIDEISKDVE